MNVEVSLQIKPEPVKDPNMLKNPLDKEPIPGDLTLGVIDAEPLIRNYAEIAELESAKRKFQTSISLDKYEIQSVKFR